MERNEQASGAVLVSGKTHCRISGEPLYVRTFRISKVVVYDEVKGSFLASKIPKVCSNNKCNFIQHYGYYTVGNEKCFDDDWSENECLLSSARTAFNINLLEKMKVKILIAKTSFKGKADIYNAVHGYQLRVVDENDVKTTEGSR